MLLIYMGKGNKSIRIFYEGTFFTGVQARFSKGLQKTR
jgi:hypothetical protein